MQQSDREHRMDDENATRPTGEEQREEQSPVIRLLANPRRVRRA